MKKFFLFSFSLLFLGGCGNTYSTQNDAYSTRTPPPVVPVITPVILSTNTISMTTSTPEQKTFLVTLHTTDGDIEITLNNDQTPKTVENFVTLAKKNFYDNTIFHRVIKGFMIQGGDPEGTGRGGPGYQFDDEPFTGEYTRGTVAMANAGPNTNGSQFFIMHQDYRLDHAYTIFGHVTKGMNVVDTIAESPVESSGREKSKPIHPVKIKNVTVVEK